MGNLDRRHHDAGSGAGNVGDDGVRSGRGRCTGSASPTQRRRERVVRFTVSTRHGASEGYPSLALCLSLADCAVAKPDAERITNDDLVQDGHGSLGRIGDGWRVRGSRGPRRQVGRRPTSSRRRQGGCNRRDRLRERADRRSHQAVSCRRLRGNRHVRATPRWSAARRRAGKFTGCTLQRASRRRSDDPFNHACGRDHCPDIQGSKGRRREARALPLKVRGSTLGAARRRRHRILW